MNNLNKTLADVFDIAPIPEEKKEKLPVLQTHYNEPDLKQDLTDAYQQSRENLQGLIDQQYKGKGLAGLLYKELNRLTGTFIEGNPLSNNYRNIKLNQNCGYSIVHTRVYLKYDTLNICNNQ